MSLNFFYLIIIGLFLICIDIYSQDSINLKNENKLSEIIIKTGKIELNIEKTPRFISVLGQNEIQKSASNTVQELLYFQSNIDVRQRGTFGIQADISIRGGNQDQTAILLNGINISNPQTGHNSFDLPISLMEIERIEILEGPSSFAFGANALSGGINISTFKIPQNLASVSFIAGSYGLFSTNLNGGISTKKTTHLISLNHSSSDGYIKNSDFNNMSLFSLNTFKNKNIYFELQTGLNKKEFGANTFYSGEFPNQFENKQSIFTSLKGETYGKLKFIPIIYFNKFNDEFQLFRDGTPNIPLWYKTSNFHQTEVFGLNIMAQYNTNLGITNLSSEIRNESILSNILGIELQNPKGKYTKSDQRTIYSYYLEHLILLKKLSLSLGIVANKTKNYQENIQFYPTINAKYFISDNLKILGLFSQASRNPTFTELYYTTRTHKGNTNLEPEKSTSYEIGFNYSHKKIETLVNVFYTKNTNLIDWIKQNPEDKWESKNLTQINKLGIEIKFNFLLHDFWNKIPKETELSLGYFYLNQNQKIENNLISNYILDNLKHKFTVQIKIPIYKKTWFFTNFRWQDRAGEYLKYENYKPIQKTEYQPYSLVDLKLETKINNFKLHINANNIFNHTYYDLGNVPQPGFWISTGINYIVN